MNKKILLAVLAIFSCSCFAQSMFDLNELSSQMESSYKSGFYPGVIRYAEQILQKDSSSVAAVRAAVYEGESLFRMGRTDEALKVLSKYSLKTKDSESNYINSARSYWLGRCCFLKKSFEVAQECFYSSAQLFLKIKSSKGKSDYYSASMLWGARTYINQKNEKSAVPLLEYVVANGNKYEPSDFEECAENLTLYLNSLGQAQKSEKISAQILEKAEKNSDFYHFISLNRGDSLVLLERYREAYDVFCSVLASSPSYIASLAMQKAYEVSSQYKAQVGSEPGAVLLKAKDRLAEYPDLLGEFWTRLAIDAYSAGDFKKALSYFDEAKTVASESQLVIASIYRAQISFEMKGRGEKGSAEALKALDDAEKIISDSKSLSAQQGIIDLFFVNKARFYGYLREWTLCEEASEKVIAAAEKDVAMQACYWHALSKYEGGKTSDAVSEIEKFRNERLSAWDYTADAPILNLYAKALAKSGKYAAADQVFYRLGQSGALNNDGHLDYSRTLLKGGHYISTKEQASLASGDEAVYLAALASFNQRRWEEAEKGFNRTVLSQTLKNEHKAYSRFYLGYAQYQLGEYEKSVSNLTAFIKSNPLHPLIWSANMTCARGAAFLKNYDVAVNNSASAVKSAKTEKEKEEAVLLNAGVLAESKRYDEALSVLEPYREQKRAFGYECKFRSGEILVQKGDISGADSYFAELSALNTNKEALSVAEDSAYRRGEIHYSAEDYKKAQEYFEQYLKKFPAGRFVFAAIYFSADCLARNGERDRAVLRYLQIVDSSEQTTYRYGSEKNLVYLYEDLGEYENGIKMARKMIEEYGNQAVTDGMADKVKELSKKKTEAVESPSLPADASKDVKAIAEAVNLRVNGQSRLAAQKFLDAAVYSREVGNARNAARSLYGAVEAFDAAGMTGDAKATFEEMKKMYPDDTYTVEAQKLMKD